MRSALSLGLFAAICTALLAMINQATAPVIKAARDSQRFRAAEELTAITDHWRWDADQQAFLHPAHPQLRVELRRARGYGGEIEVAVALDAGQIVNLQVLRHQETPGIGDFIETRRSPWTSQFIGRDPTALGDVEGRSGATITATAMLRAVTTPPAASGAAP